MFKSSDLSKTIHRVKNGKKEDKSWSVYFSLLYMGFVSLIKWFYLIMKPPPTPKKEVRKIDFILLFGLKIKS